MFYYDLWWYYFILVHAESVCELSYNIYDYINVHALELCNNSVVVRVYYKEAKKAAMCRIVWENICINHVTVYYQVQYKCDKNLKK